jgi:pyruvate,water dikinase
VESSIRYLPLYPDDPDVVFNEEFLRGAPSSLARLVPDLAHLSEVVRVIDVQAVTGGHVLRVLANADLDEAIGYLCAAPAPAAGRRD